MCPARIGRLASETLPQLRFDVAEAARILRMSRAQLYLRIGDGSIRPQKDGTRTYLTRAELERYVKACAKKPSRSRVRILEATPEPTVVHPS